MNPIEKMNYVNIILEADIVVQGVLISLAVFSIVSWGIILKKRTSFKGIKYNDKKFLEIYSDSETLRDVMIRSEMLPFSPCKVMFEEGFGELEKLKKIKKDQISVHFEKFGFNGIERALHQGVNDSNIKMGSFLTILASIGSVSPFIGLFGTVWGIINSFTGLASGGGTIEAVAPGIAEALIATAVGLAAAIPAVWFYNYFTNENARINVNMDSFGQSFLNKVERSLGK